MEQIKIEINIILIENMFKASKKCREYTIDDDALEDLQSGVSKYLTNGLLRGLSVSLQDAFEATVSDILELEEDWLI